MLAEAQPAAGGSMMSSLLIMLPLFAIMYFLWIRPQQKKQKEHDEMLTHIKAGDKVMTTSGIVAKVVKVQDKHVVLEIAEKTCVEFVQGAVASIIKDEKDEKEAAIEKK